MRREHSANPSSPSVVAALILNASLRLFTSVPLDLDKTRERRLITFVFMTTSVLCVLSGAYTTVVFTLIQLYAKRALGMSLDESYLSFFEQTAKYRTWGFYAFLWCLKSFTVSFSCSLFLKIERKDWRYVTGITTVVAMSIMLHHWYDILHIATLTLF